MASGVYNKKTLNGKLQKLFLILFVLIDNWYEERLAQQQLYREEPDRRIVSLNLNCLILFHRNVLMKLESTA